jgi:hypothetical protein
MFIVDFFSWCFMALAFLYLTNLNLNVTCEMQKQTQKRLKSGFKIISWTVSTLEGGGSITLPALYTLSSLRFWLARNARAYTSARSIGFCVIWVCISSSSSSRTVMGNKARKQPPFYRHSHMVRFESQDKAQFTSWIASVPIGMRTPIPFENSVAGIYM